METVTKDFLVGTWVNKEWECELNTFNYLTLKWPNSGKAYGAWVLRNKEVIFTYRFEGTDYKQLYLFSIEEIIDNNTIMTKDLERNKTERLVRKIG